MLRARVLNIVHPSNSPSSGSPVPLKPLEPTGSERSVQIQIRGAQRWVERVALVVLVVAFVIKGFVPAWVHLNSDFPNYYLAARLYHAGYPFERVYDWTWFQRQKDHQGIEQGLVSFIGLTPASALVLTPWSSLPPLAAKHGWLAMNVLLLVSTTFLLGRMTKLGWERVALVMFLAWVPLRNNFLFGQMHILVLFLLTFGAWLYFRNFPFLAGISLAAAAALKIYPGLFLIYFAWKKQWRAAAGVLIGVITSIAGSLYFFGRDACRLYAVQELPAGLRGETLDPYHPAWNSWTALLRRLFIAEPELNPVPVAHSPWLYALLHPMIHGSILIVFLWAIGSKQQDTERTKVEWAAFLYLLLFLSSQPGSYHFVALILTAALVCDYLIAREQWRRVAFVAAIYALIGAPVLRFPWATPTGWQNLWFFSRLGWMAVFGGLLLAIVLKLPREELLARFRFENRLVAGSALFAIVIIGFVLNQRHLKGQFENYNARIATVPDDLVASDPAISRVGLLFTRMIPGGYTIGRLQADTTQNLASVDGDLFHPAVSDTTDVVWAEESSRQGSRIIRLSVDAARHQASLATEADDAQEPVVSRDGEFLAFLRPIKGHNGLWLRRVGSSLEPAAEHRIVGENYDVREATFLPDHRVIFSSKQRGQFRLYIATQEGKIEALESPSCSARYPAISPDGRWMAFSCEQGGGAQVHVMKWGGGMERQLTTGDCRSVSPAWTSDSQRLIYATDCGRGLGLTALAEVNVFH